MISSRSAFAPRTLAAGAALAVAGSALLALSAQVSVSMLPVPITLQTLAIPLLVLGLGRNIAVAATLAYLFEGAAGLPVFAGFSSGAALAGPTAGYLWAYPLAASAMGTLLDRGLGATYAGRWAAIFAGTLLVFAAGIWWLMAGFGLSGGQAVAAGVTPFVFGDLLKCSLAAALPSQAARVAARFGLGPGR